MSSCYCYGMRSVMLQINEYDDDDDEIRKLKYNNSSATAGTADRGRPTPSSKEGLLFRGLI